MNRQRLQGFMRIWLAIVIFASVATLGSVLCTSTTTVPHATTAATATTNLPITTVVPVVVTPPASDAVSQFNAAQSQVDDRLDALDPLVPPIQLQASSDPRVAATQGVFAHGALAEFHPHGDQICASGCAASRHPTERLTDDRFTELLEAFSVEPTDPPGEALETLLYFGRQSATLLDRLGSSPLDGPRLALLQRELARSHAEISIRLVDDAGVVRAALPATRVPLDRRHEFKLIPQDLPPLIVSGTVKRVGRDHLWTRL